MVIRSKQKLNISKPFNIVLVEPEIPPNTGNIARLCAATNTKLHLVHPLGFEITDRKLKRAGLDYWHLLDVKEYDSWEKFYRNVVIASKAKQSVSKIQNEIASVTSFPRNDCEIWFMSTRGEKNIWDVDFSSGDYLIFGSETKGLDENILNQHLDRVVSIPMNGLTRSLNLSTAVGIVLYEAIRQANKKREYTIAPV